jgi:hypothetical protein
MDLFINRLPLDIIQKIIPYTYNTQNKSLLCDICNYKKSRTTLSKIYTIYWTNNLQYGPNGANDWIINDIFSFANNHKASMYGYVDRFYGIFRRNPFLQTKGEIDNYLSDLEDKHVTTQINIFWGLLTVDERNEFLHEKTSMIEEN